MTIWGTVLLYQGNCGISRGYLVVLHGALNSPFAFFPAMPPSTCNTQNTTSISLIAHTRVEINAPSAET